MVVIVKLSITLDLKHKGLHWFRFAILNFDIFCVVGSLTQAQQPF